MPEAPVIKDESHQYELGDPYDTLFKAQKSSGYRSAVGGHFHGKCNISNEKITDDGEDHLPGSMTSKTGRDKAVSHRCFFRSLKECWKMCL